MTPDPTPQEAAAGFRKYLVQGPSQDPQDAEGAFSVVACILSPTEMIQRELFQGKFAYGLRKFGYLVGLDKEATEWNTIGMTLQISPSEAVEVFKAGSRYRPDATGVVGVVFEYKEVD